MRNLPFLIIPLAFTACTGGTGEGSDTPNKADTVVTQAVVWPGYYTGTLPCADCPGIETALWVRSDSTYILQRKYSDKDSIPTGIMGEWGIVQSDMILRGSRPEAPMRWRWHGNGLTHVTLDGAPIAGPIRTMQRVADEIGGAIPRMQLTGTFTYMADAQSFKPCGSSFTWPCVGGIDQGKAQGGPSNTFDNLALQKAYAAGVKQAGDPWTITAVCTIALGPAMEGEGADEYIFVERISGTLDHCP